MHGGKDCCVESNFENFNLNLISPRYLLTKFHLFFYNLDLYQLAWHHCSMHEIRFK